MPERYCVPTSLPWRMPCVGSWLSQNLEQVLERDDGGIVDDEDDLVMAGAAGAHLLVGRIGRGPACIAGSRHPDALPAPEGALGAPEAAKPEHDRLHAFWVRSLERATVDEMPLG